MNEAEPGRGGCKRLPRRFWFVIGLTTAVVLGFGFALVLPQARAWYHFRAAEAAVRSYHTPQAIVHLQACLRTWPDDPDVLLLSARVARRARVYADAARCLDLYRKQRGADNESSLEEMLLGADRNVDWVAEVCRRYVEQGHPQTALILEALTRGYLRQYRLAEARFCLQRWLEREPDNPQALCMQGEFELDYAHNRSMAVTSYRRAVAVDPEHEDARLGLAVTLLELKELAEAARHLEELRRRQPDNLRLRVGLAQCRHGLGDQAGAAALLDDILAVEPGYSKALSLRGQIALESSDSVAAEKWLRAAIEHDPGDRHARYNLSRCLTLNGKEAEAQAQTQQLKELEKDLERFNEIVTRELTHRPRDPALHLTLGEILLRGGHRAEGLRCVQNALRLNPQFAAARKALAQYRTR